MRGRPEAIPVVNIVSGRGTGGPRRTGQLVAVRSCGDLVAISCDLVSARHAQSLLALRGGARGAADTECLFRHRLDVGELAAEPACLLDRAPTSRARPRAVPVLVPCTVCGLWCVDEGGLSRVSLVS